MTGVGYGFSGGGFAFGYHIGAIKALRELGLLHQDTPLAGVSAGSIIAAAVKCAVPTADILTLFLTCLADLRLQGTAGRLEGVLRTSLEKYLPANAHELCSGSLWIGITTLFPYPKHTQVNTFKSRPLLIESLLASCFVPRYSCASWTRHHQGKLIMDGGFTSLVPSLPQPYKTIKVCCLPASRVKKLPFLNKRQAMEGVAIAPDLWNHDQDLLDEMVQWINYPGEEEVYVRLVDKAYKDTLSWADAGHSADLGLQAIPTAVHDGSR